MFAREIRQGKEQQHMVEMHKRANYSNLSEAYAKASSDKWDAFNYCKSKQRELDGFNFRITSYNTYWFTAAFQFIDKETGVLRLYYITRDHDYVCDYI